MINQQLNSVNFNGVNGEAHGGSIFSFRIESNGIESPPKYIVSVVYPPRNSGNPPVVALNTTATISVGSGPLGGAGAKLFGISYEDNPEYSAECKLGLEFNTECSYYVLGAKYPEVAKNSWNLTTEQILDWKNEYG